MRGALIFFTLLAQINLLLMLFNLIPLGPLDGHYILPHLLPAGLAQRYRYLNAPLRHRCFSGSGCPQLGRLTVADRANRTVTHHAELDYVGIDVYLPIPTCVIFNRGGPVAR